jgi:hypothetical protein
MRQRQARGIEFGPLHDFAEIGRVAVSYMLRLGSDEARVGRLGQFIWLRLRVGDAYTNILFRLEVKRAAKDAATASRPRRISGTSRQKKTEPGPSRASPRKRCIDQPGYLTVTRYA